MKKINFLPYVSLLLLLIIPLLISFVPVQAKSSTGLDNTYVNATTGNNSYDGSSPTFTGGIAGPKKTIQDAIDITNETGTVHVAAGTYTERIHLSSNMNLVGAGALSTTIDGNHTGCVVTVSSAPFQTNTISGFTITGGYPAGSDCGGGIYISSSHIVTINDCTITNNYKQAGSSPKPNQGGGICNDNGNVHMNRCTVHGNYAGYQGGGIANLCDFGGTDFGKMWLTNCTVTLNTVSGDGAVGGGLYNSSNADVTLLNVTISGNRAIGTNAAGGGFSNSSLSSMYFKNSIVANNTATLTQYNNGYNGLGSGVNSQGNNLSSDNSCYFNQPSDQVNTNPQLGPLQNNGGSTSTCAITKSSPAYNRGNLSVAPATDQRGFTRPAGICSIGAYEVVATSASIGTNLGTVNFGVGAGTINNLVHLRVVDTRCATPAGYDFPYGLFSFNINDLTAGQTVRITIKFPRTLPLNVKYYKCINGKMVDCARIMTRINDYTLALDITDGGFGDADGLANGTIVDPGGPVEPLAAAQVYGQGTIPTVTQQAPVALPSISVKSASLSASRVGPGTPVTVTANVANTGTVNGTSSIKVYVNGEVENSQGITVSSGSNTPITFTVTRNDPGTYSVYVGGTSAGSFIVDQFADGTILFISGAMILFALVIGVIYITRRRQAY